MVTVSDRIFLSFLVLSPAPSVFSVPLPILFTLIRPPSLLPLTACLPKQFGIVDRGAEREPQTRRSLTKDRSECPDIERRI